MGILTDIAISTASKPGVDTCAERSLALFTIPAAAISHVEGHHNSVSLFEQRHTGADLFDNTHVLMTESDS